MLSLCVAAILSFFGAFVNGIQIDHQSSNDTYLVETRNFQKTPTISIHLSEKPNDATHLITPIRLERNTISHIQIVKRRRRATDNELFTNNSFEPNEVRWTNINNQVDMVIPLVLSHFQELQLTHLDLPNMRETISLKPIFITYTAGLWLQNGIAYNIQGIRREGDAVMTYKDKAFLCRFYLLIRSLQFNYDFTLKVMAIEGYGNVIGTLDDTLIYAELYINVDDVRLRLNDFRIVRFNNIRVELNHRQLVREITGVILSPITNLFRDRITTYISDGLKGQMQEIMDDFNNKDPLGLKKFTKRLLGSLTGQNRDK